MEIEILHEMIQWMNSQIPLDFDKGILKGTEIYIFNF